MDDSGFFIFGIPRPNSIGIPEKVLVLFKAIGRLRHGETDAALYEALQVGAPPDHIIILVPDD